MTAGFTVKKATPEEWQASAMTWGAQLQWNVGQHDCKTFMEQDPDGFFVGLVRNNDGTEETVGSVCGVKYGEDMGFIGLYIVQQEYRKKGYGLELFQTAMKHLEGRNIGLDAVVEQIHNYKRSGFHETHWNVRYSFRIEPIMTTTGFPDFDPTLPLQWVRQDRLDPQQIIQFEKHVVGLSRKPEFWTSLISQPNCRVFAVRQKLVDTSDCEQYVLKGLVAIRQGVDHYRVGPLYATEPAIAEALMDRICSLDDLTGQYVLVDIVAENKHMGPFLKRYKMKELAKFSRMWTGGQIVEDLHVCYAPLSLELA